MVSSIRKKGEQLFKEGKVKKDFETDKRIYFTVTSSEIHSVIFDKTKNTWECDCKYFALKGKECSHIYACKLYLSR